MDLLIRSQDKTQLLKVIGLYYDYQQEKHHITAITENDYYWLGIYKSKERALEVLDEIQNILKPIIINKQIKSDGMLADGLSDVVLHTYNVNEIQELSTYVYEMPEE